MMKSSGSWRVFISVLIAAGFACLAEVVDGANEFRRCYNTSVEMHCFTVQYSANNGRLITSNDNARQRCRNLNSTLLIIKDEETNNIVQNYMSDPYNPIRSQYVWTDAYRVNDYNNSYTWHWVNPKLPNLAALEVGYDAFIYNNDYYTTTLECRSDNGKPLQFYLTAKLPQGSYNYLCEYSVSRCPTNASNALQFLDRCYISFSASVSWYEARNRCLRDGGDLASFANVTSINFTSWLGSDPNVGFWIGLRFSWHIWKDSGENVKFSNWHAAVYNDWSLPCLTVCPNCNPSYSWLAKDCNAGDTCVVCHTVTPLPTTTLTTSRPTTTLPVTLSADIKTQPGTTQSNNPGSKSSRIENSAGSRPIGMAVGVGVGVGVPVIIAIIVIVICVSRRVTHKKQKTRSDNTKLEAVHESSVEKVNDSANSQYQQLNHGLENSSGTMYDELRISPETPSVGEVDDSANSQYEQLNRSVENSPGTTYDELRVSPETPYEEFPPQRS